jgi:small subunit ribosomal protein S16
MGKKKQPFYRIIAIDSRSRRDGKYIDNIGYYNPLTHPAEIVVNEEKVFQWLKNGAIPSDTVKSLFSKKGIMVKWHLMKEGHDQEKIAEEFKKWEVLQLEREKRLEAKQAQVEREKEEKKSTKEESVAEVKPESVPEAAELKAEEPIAEVEAKQPVVEVEVKQPVVEAEAKMLVVEAEVNQPVVEAEAKAPEAEA